ncbi:hypothetical protein IWX91DRAFT_66395 [Phyllosticta citricarpa]
MARSGHRRSMYIAAHFQRLLVLISKIGACVSTTDIDCARDDGQNYYRGEGAAAAAAAAAWGRQFVRLVSSRLVAPSPTEFRHPDLCFDGSMQNGASLLLLMAPSVLSSLSPLPWLRR